MSKPIQWRNAPIVLVGSGRLARALGRLLRERGAPLAAIAGRHRARTQAAARFIGGIEAIALEAAAQSGARLLIAVSDAAVTEVAARLAWAGGGAAIALHTCGSQGPEALAALRRGGTAAGVFHPLQSVPTPERGVRTLPGSYFAVGGDGAARAWARQMLKSWGGRALAIRRDGWPLYHAAAVLASNCQIALIAAAAELVQAAGADGRDSVPALAALMRATLEQALELGPAAALTGPIARGDVSTVRRHRAALASRRRGLDELYCAAGRRTLLLAARRGLTRPRIAALGGALGASAPEELA